MIAYWTLANGAKLYAVGDRTTDTETRVQVNLVYERYVVLLERAAFDILLFLNKSIELRKLTIMANHTIVVRSF